MATTYTVPNTFYLRWHQEGNNQGQWEGSASSTNDGFYQLSWWQLSAASQSYDFNFSTVHSSGASGSAAAPYTVFSTMTDNGTVYGLKFSSASMINFTPVGSLKFSAGQLISDDPKINISSSTSQPTCYLAWDGQKWLSSFDQQSWTDYVCGTDIVLGPDASGTCSVTVEDRSGATAMRTAAAYYQSAALGTNVGYVQDQGVLQPTAAWPQYTLTVTQSCTVNLFAALSGGQATLARG